MALFVLMALYIHCMAHSNRTIKTEFLKKKKKTWLNLLINLHDVLFYPKS